MQHREEVKPDRRKRLSTWKFMLMIAANIALSII
jgi:hypothetical protein